MKGLENTAYMWGLIISNIVALLMLWAAIKQPRLGRSLFALLFAGACWMNWRTAINTPLLYLDYGEMAMLPVYREWISGWFAKHITLYIGLIATCPGLIAISMLLKGPILKIGAIGAIIFLLAIVPLGVGSAFPCTLIMAVAMMYVYRQKEINFLWVQHREVALR